MFVVEKILRELRKSKESINEHIMAGGCPSHQEYIAALAKYRAYESIEQYLIELNKSMGEAGE